MSITGGITDGSLFGGTGNDSFNFTGGGATGLVDTGTGSDSVMFGALGDTITITGVLTSTSINALLVQIHLLSRPTCPLLRWWAELVQTRSISQLDLQHPCNDHHGWCRSRQHQPLRCQRCC